ncbi:MAG TPA: hypothetical protein VIM99_08490 [Blastocatellia bacterium]
MKRQLIFLMIVLPLLSLPVSIKVHAQDPTGALPGTKPPTGGTASPAPTPKPAARGSKSAPNMKVTLTLSVGEESRGRLDPRTSDKNIDGSFYEEMILTAKSEDLLSFHIEGDNPLLGLQILDKSNANAEVPVAKDASGDFRFATPTGGAPADGEYRVRVTGVLIGKNPLPFTIKVTRLGLTSIAYNERFNKIFTSYNDKDPASVQATVSQLEELSRDNPTRPTAFERLGMIYLDPLRDIEKAQVAFEQAIKAQGVAIIQISFDSQWRRMVKSKSGDYGFEDARTGWIKIGPGQVTIADAGNNRLAVVSGTQIRELSKNLVSAYSLVTITADNGKKPYVFMPKSTAAAETDLIIKLIQNHVVGKAY